VFPPLICPPPTLLGHVLFRVVGYITYPKAARNGWQRGPVPNLLLPRLAVSLLMLLTLQHLQVLFEAPLPPPPLPPFCRYTHPAACKSWHPLTAPLPTIHTIAAFSNDARYIHTPPDIPLLSLLLLPPPLLLWLLPPPPLLLLLLLLHRAGALTV